jgi:hypothetical protein
MGSYSFSIQKRMPIGGDPKWLQHFAAVRTMSKLLKKEVENFDQKVDSWVGHLQLHYDRAA